MEQLALFAVDKPGVLFRCPSCGRRVEAFVPAAAWCSRCGRRMQEDAGVDLAALAEAIQRDELGPGISAEWAPRVRSRW